MRKGKENRSLEGKATNNKETNFHTRQRFVSSYSPCPHFHASDCSFSSIARIYLGFELIGTRESSNNVILIYVVQKRIESNLSQK